MGEAEFREDGAQLTCNFGSHNGSEEFSFDRTCGTQFLCGALVGNCSIGKGENIAHGGAAVVQVVGMFSVNTTSEGEWIRDRGESR